MTIISRSAGIAAAEATSLAATIWLSHFNWGLRYRYDPSQPNR